MTIGDSANFQFLQPLYTRLYTICCIAEKLIDIDPSSSLAKSRLCAEYLTQIIGSIERIELTQEGQSKIISQLYSEEIIPSLIKDILHAIRKSGNRASHAGEGSREDAIFILKKLFKLTQWFFQTYENATPQPSEYTVPTNKITNVDIEKLNKHLAELEKQVDEHKKTIDKLNNSVQSKKQRRKRSEIAANNIHLDEKETRIILIDPKLRVAGWECDTNSLNFKNHGTLPQKGRNIAIAEWRCGSKWADYALFVGTTLYGIIEAKRFSSDISTNLGQSKIYANNIVINSNFEILGEWQGYKAPFLFSTNGREYLEQLKTKSGIWFKDIRTLDIPKPIQGWYSPEGLVVLYTNDSSVGNNKLTNNSKGYLQDPLGLSLRDYQIEAIDAIEKKIVSNKDTSRSLLVMATGTGKTRTAIGLAYRLIKSNRFKRILFLADRRLLVTQASGDFKDKRIENLNTFANIYQISDIKDKHPDEEARLHFATVQGMVSRIFGSGSVDDGEQNKTPISIDTYDCIIVDEAHRGYIQDREMDDEDTIFRDQADYVSKYKRVIDFFEAHIIALTATPALHTTEIFGNPIYSYSYRQAVIDGNLCDHEPPYLFTTQLSEDGILFEKGDTPKAYDPETNTIEELAALEDELHFEVEHFNKQVIAPSFNQAIIKELVQRIDPTEEGKTLIFAARDSHADMIVDLLFEEFANIGIDLPSDAIMKITGKAYKPEDLTLRFKNERNPNIVVTVDLLSTGVDVPKITNLVFLRKVNSRILFEQMMGRATRKCDDIGKEYFKIYDAVKIYDSLQGFTQMQTVSKPSRTFTELIAELDNIKSDERKDSQVDQLIAKLQRRKQDIQGSRLDLFRELSGCESPNQLIDNLRHGETDKNVEYSKSKGELWKFLDERVYKPKRQFYTDQPDEVIGVDRGYGNSNKPEDYIESFKQFVESHRDDIAALNIVCTRPSELDRASLKKLKIELDKADFNEVALKTAWKQMSNKDIAADIIAFIRNVALDEPLISSEDRVKGAIAKVMEMHPWNTIQQKWIGRFEAQLIKETILTREDLDKEPFSTDGGFQRLNKIFNYELDRVLQTINEYLFTA